MLTRSLSILLLAAGAAALTGCRTPLPQSVRAPVVARTPVAVQPSVRSCDLLKRCMWIRGPERKRPFRRWQVELEAGPVWQTRNDVALPGDTGTRFALDDVTGAGAFPWGRVTVDYRISPRHSVRAMIAPLEISETGTLNQPVSFDGRTFAAGPATKATFRFNSYRLTYRYLLASGCDWAFHIGATAKIRDAKIELEQGGVIERSTDLGFVPLLHVAFEKRFSKRWRMTADLDGAAAPQGRAFDFAAKLHHDFNDRWSIGLGYRTLEGGADNDTVYTFTWLHQAVLSATYRF